MIFTILNMCNQCYGRVKSLSRDFRKYVKTYTPAKFGIFRW